MISLNVMYRLRSSIRFRKAIESGLLLTMTSTIFAVTHAHKKALIIVISSISIISVWLYFGTNASSCHGPSAGSLA